MDNSGIYLSSSLMEHESSRPDKNPDPLLWPELNRLLLESAGHGDRRATLAVAMQTLSYPLTLIVSFACGERRGVSSKQRISPIDYR